MEKLPSEGIWSLVIKRREPCKIVPANVMMISRVVIPEKLRAQDGTKSGNWRCRLFLMRLDPTTKEPVDKAVIASLVPGSIDMDGLEVYLFPGEQYALQVVGGGEYLHVLGEFPKEYASHDSAATVIRRFKTMPDDASSGSKKDDKGKPRDDSKGQGRDDARGDYREGEAESSTRGRTTGGALGVKIK